jgi:hypothetical protein
MPSLSILKNMFSSYDDYIFRQAEAFGQINNFLALESNFLLLHEEKQKNAIVLGSDDINNVDTINFTVSSTIKLVNSRAQIDDTPPIVASRISKDIKDELSELLQSQGKGYIEILKGAKQTASSNNPEKVTHTFSSLRKLTNRILFNFAPDNKVNQWHIDNGGIIKGNPTRELRLQYIFRNYSSSNITPLINCLNHRLCR